MKENIFEKPNVYQRLLKELGFTSIVYKNDRFRKIRNGDEFDGAVHDCMNVDYPLDNEEAYMNDYAAYCYFMKYRNI